MGTAPRKILPDHKIQLAKILVATDFSPASNNAFAYAVSLARCYDSRILLAHVIALDAYPLAAPEVTTHLVETQRRAAEAKIQEVLFSGQLQDVPQDTLIVEGPLWPAIQRLIEKQAIDLVVVGTHGIGAIQKLVIGSGAEQIFRQATCPVLTVGPAVGSGASPNVDFKHVLFATDFGPGCEREAAYAFSLGQEHDATVTLLHVVRHMDDYSEDGLTLKREVIKQQLQDLVPSGAEAWCQTQLRMAVGDPAAEILRYAQETHADLIVMGAKARSGLAGHVPVTKAYKVVSLAHCPVLTVRS
ncbi:MAG TPA: universal stress protein [Candidatus Angelobacter sp.]|nr:universal stress protein [Candidatus Angelobacter sp.]